MRLTLQLISTVVFLVTNLRKHQTGRTQLYIYFAGCLLSGRMVYKLAILYTHLNADMYTWRNVIPAPTEKSWVDN